MRRMLCVWFPHWTIQRWRQTDPDTRSAALVVSAESDSRGLRVAACCPHASQSGVRAGMPLAEARALLQPLQGARVRTCWKSADPATDRQTLRQMALDCQRYTPLTGLDAAAESVLLDITGCAGLFGDERGLLDVVTRDLTQRGFRIRTAIADGIGAAWAVARAGETGTIIPPGGQQQALEPLPVGALRISPAIADSLDRLAVHTIGDLLRLPRTSLTSRFGPELVLRLDQALGVTWESFTPERLTVPLAAHWSADDPLTDQRQLAFVFRQLLKELLAQLCGRRAGLLELQCNFRTESQSMALPLRLARPAIDPRQIAQLFELACARQRWPGSIYAFHLEAQRIGSLDERQATLLDAERDSRERDIMRLVERLSSRLGEQAVLRPVAVADPLPERSLRLIPWLADEEVPPTESSVPSVECRLARPWRLLPCPPAVEVMATAPHGPPRRLTWQGRTWDIRQGWGPERIESGWWRGWDIQRDYYRVETEEGFQFWLYRDQRAGGWYLHGIFD